jgi:tRNA nucleotidyltransferase (CCA-adding enzyme)
LFPNLFLFGAWPAVDEVSEDVPDRRAGNDSVARIIKRKNSGVTGGSSFSISHILCNNQSFLSDLIYEYIGMTIEEKVLAKIKPSKIEQKRVMAAVDMLIKKVKATPTAGEVEFEPCLVGSIAKGTYNNGPDIDLFLLFDPALPRKKLEKYGISVGKESIGGREHYAEHPYIRGVFEGLKVDIVPAYKIIDSSQKMTAVDRTPFHTEYVKTNLPDENRDCVRLLKQFMKGIGTYGAEAKVEGFSGYLCELLVLKFGGFKDVLEKASGWREGEYLAMDKSEKRYFIQPLVFIDPVDPQRNVASAVSRDSFARFIHASREYLARPKIEFFFPKEKKILSRKKIDAFLKHRGEFLTITLPKPDLIDDILYPQIKKAQRNVCQLLELKDFTVIDSWSGTFENLIVLLFELEHFELSLASLHGGPPVWITENSEEFVSRWRDDKDALSEPFVKDGRWHLFIRRKHPRAGDLVFASTSSLDIGKDLNTLKGHIKICGPVLHNERWLSHALSEYLDRRPPWDR